MNPQRTLTLLLLFLVASVGCGLFQTRDPAKPKFQQFPCYTLTAPGNVYVNILQAYGDPTGLGCFVSTLSDTSFRFHPDPADSQANPTQFELWDKAIEERVAENFANQADQDSTYDLLFTDVDTVSVDNNQQLRRIHYTINFRRLPPDTIYQGIADIQVVRDEANNEWHVTDWVDRRDPGGTTTRTWGYLRASYRIGF